MATQHLGIGLSRNERRLFVHRGLVDRVTRGYDEAGRATLQIHVAENLQTELEVYDVRGSLVDARTEMLNAGLNQLDFKTENVAPGTHFAKVQVGQQVLYRQFVVTR